MASFNEHLRVCLQTRLSSSIQSLWPDGQAAERYWQLESVPMVKSMGFRPLCATLLPNSWESPSVSLLKGLYASIKRKPPADQSDFPGAIRHWARDFQRVRTFGVLMLLEMDAWAGNAWSNDVAAFRAMKQTFETELFVIFACSSRQAFSELFARYEEPLYHEGATVIVDAKGNSIT
jgi:hypothetical protein